MIKTRVSVFAALALCSAVGAAFVAQAPAEAVQTDAPKALERAAVDKPVKDFKLKDVMKDLKEDEKETDALVSLAQFKGKKNVVLFFMSERCGTTWRYEKRFGQMLKDYKGKPVAFMGVRSSANDTPESIRKFAEAKNFAMPVLDDTNNRMADYFKVRVTPTFVVLDKKGNMRYFGSFDDSPEESDVENKYLRPAVDAVLKGEQVAVKETRAFG